MSSLPMVSEQTFERDVINSDLPVLVEFGAEWCGPCKTVAPELIALSRDLEGKAKILQVDVDKSPRLAQMMQIQSVPTYVVFFQGRPVDAANGVLKKAQLHTLLEKYLPRAAGALKPAEFFQLLEKGQITPVDTRPTEVFARAHIRGAVNFPLTTIDEHIADLHMLPAPAVLYSRDGKDTQEKATQLAELGSPVAFLEGGILAWEGDGHMLERQR